MDVESRSVCINQKFTLIYAADVEVNDPCGMYLDLARASHGREACLVVRPSRGRTEGTCCTGNSVLQVRQSRRDQRELVQSAGTLIGSSIYRGRRTIG